MNNVFYSTFLNVLLFLPRFFAFLTFLFFWNAFHIYGLNPKLHYFE